MHILAHKTYWNSKMSGLGVIVFELKTLLDVTNEKRDDDKPDAIFEHRNETYYIYKREHCDSLMHWMQKYNVKCGIWSCETRKYTYKSLSRVFDVKKFEFVKTRRSCTVYNDYYVKPLNNVKRRMLLYDFNIEQGKFHIDENMRHAVYIDVNADLKSFNTFLKKNEKLFIEGVQLAFSIL